MKNILGLTLISICFIICLYGCSDNIESYFGLELEDDADLPSVIIRSPLNNSNIENSEFITIEYSAQDISGIDTIELYANNKLVREFSKDNINGYIYWYWQDDSITNHVELQLKAVDGVGKTSWSNKVSINLDYTTFEMIDMSGYDLIYNEYNTKPTMHSAADNSIWFQMKGNRLLRYNNGEFSVVNIEIPSDLNLWYTPFPDDFFISKSGNIYLDCNSSDVEVYYLLYQRDGKWTYYTGQVHSFTESNDGTVYCVSGLRTILRIDKTSAIDTVYKDSDSFIEDLTFDANNNLCFYNRSKEAIYRQVGKNYLPIFNISSWELGVQFTFDKLNNIFVKGYENSIHDFYINDEKINLENGLLDRYSRFAVVNKNEIWFTTDHSLIRYKDNSFKVYTNLNSNIPNDSYNNIVSDSNGNIYVYYNRNRKLLIVKNNN